MLEMEEKCFNTRRQYNLSGDEENVEPNACRSYLSSRGTTSILLHLLVKNLPREEVVFVIVPICQAPIWSLPAAPTPSTVIQVVMRDNLCHLLGFERQGYIRRYRISPHGPVVHFFHALGPSVIVLTLEATSIFSCLANITTQPLGPEGPAALDLPNVYHFMYQEANARATSREKVDGFIDNICANRSLFELCEVDEVPAHNNLDTIEI